MDIIKRCINEGYIIQGCNIISKTGRLLSSHIGSQGYPIITVHFGNKRLGTETTHPVSVHRLKAYALYGDKVFDTKLEVRHLNGNKLDCSDENIVLGTHSENMQDIPKYIRVRSATKAVSSLRKFTDGEVEQIRKIHKSGIGYNRLSKAYKVCKTTIAYLIQKRTYNKGESPVGRGVCLENT